MPVYETLKWEDHILRFYSCTEKPRQMDFCFDGWSATADC